MDLATGRYQLGAVWEEGTGRFLVWAPNARSMQLHVTAPEEQTFEMEPIGDGYFQFESTALQPGSQYLYRINGEVERPDPASRLQADSVHGPSVLVEKPGPATGDWKGLPLEQYILYELHVGTFTPSGTLDDVIPCLDRLRDLGITAIELMPLAAFPGDRNWGYDGVYPFAVQQQYGGPAALRRLADACHERGMAVVLDVVYNHLGPEGNYLRDFGPYFTPSVETPWGEALNFDGPQSDDVRRFFIENALYWIEDCRVDALRLDAVHAIFDRSAYPFLQELADAIHEKAIELGREVNVIAESDLNDARLVSPQSAGGMGLDAQWSDDLHHCLHTLLTGDSMGYYADFGEFRQLVKAYREGWVYSGEYSRVRRRHFGNSPQAIEPHSLVVFSQNHDQVGNRMLGDRLVHLAGFEKAKLAAVAVILSPYTPLLFMGEEYAESAPFLYHVSHTDPDLQEAVRKGRSEEFAGFASQGTPPDPNAEETHRRSILSQHLHTSGRHGDMHSHYRALISLRRMHPALAHSSRGDIAVEADEGRRTIAMLRRHSDADAIVAMNFSGEQQRLQIPTGTWTLLLRSAAEAGSADEGISLPPWGFAVLSGKAEPSDNALEASA